MNEKISFHQLAKSMAANGGFKTEETEIFIKSFFNLIGNALKNGENVTVKSLGTFSLSGDDSDPITFTPDKEMAETVNAPFAMFRPEELCDFVSDEMLGEIKVPVPSGPQPVDMETDAKDVSPADIPEEPLHDTHSPTTETVAEETAVAKDMADEGTTVMADDIIPENEPAPIITLPNTDMVAVQAIDEPETDCIEPTATTNHEPEEETDEKTVADSNDGKFRKGFICGLIVGLAVGAVSFLLYVVFVTSQNPYTRTTDSEQYLESDIYGEEAADILP